MNEGRLWLLLGLSSVGLLAWAAAVPWLAVRRAVRVPARFPVILGAAGGFAAAATVVGLLDGPHAVSVRLALVATVVLVPVALAIYPDGLPPRGLGWVSVAVVAAAGGVAVAYPGEYAASGLAGFVAFLVVLAVQWWRVEHLEEGVDRRPLVWLSLGMVPGPLVFVGLGFIDESVATVVAAVAVVVGLVCLGVGLVAPAVRDARSLVVAVVVHIAAALLVVTVYATILSAIAWSAGHRPALSPGGYGVLAALCAVGYAPTTRMLRSTFDLLLFGDRRDPLETVSRAGEHLGDDPVLALRSLRESLVLPYAALLDEVGCGRGRHGHRSGLGDGRPAVADRPHAGPSGRRPATG